jgi:hypothetical protein
MQTLRINFASRLPPVRPLHGVNNGPVGYGTLVDVAHHYTAMRVPLVRLHDPNWPHPREVDFPQVFPDLSADTEDPASYRFGRTDDYIDKILGTGAAITYRLGVSIEHTARKDFTHPPSDPAAWARASVGIVRHYNAGWAGGRKNAVKYWEIWNEPDLDERMWSGTFEQYMDLYERTATAIKAFDPAQKVGGFATYTLDSPWIGRFLEACGERRLPIDFFSWHRYCRSPDEIGDLGRRARTMLDEHGLKHVESHLNEWNYVDFDWTTIWNQGQEQVRRASFERQKGAVGASFAAGTLIVMQDAFIDAANYYDGQPSSLFCGLFDYYGVPQPTYHAFAAFDSMRNYPQRVSVEGAESPLYAMAVHDSSAHKAALLVSHCGESAERVALELTGATWRSARVLRVADSVRPDEPLPVVARKLNITFDGPGVALVRLEN